MTGWSTSTATAEVRLKDHRVGWLDFFEDTVQYRLEFDPDWLRAGHREVLGQLFEDRLPSPVESDGLHQWFQELLPQGALRRFIETRLGLSRGDEFELLVALGDDLPGAVTIRPAAPRSVVRRPPSSPPPPAPPAAGLHLGFSLAGAQWKLSVRRGDRGLVVPTKGDTGDFIAKFADPQYGDLPRVEHATAQWARAAGIDVPPTQLLSTADFEALPEGLPTGDGAVYLIERFDRDPLVHIEDFAQVLGRGNQMSGTSEEIGVVLHALAPPDLQPFVERLAFNVVCGNGDAHLKNWSLWYPDGKVGRLSPAYDLVPSVVYLPNDALTLPIGGCRDFAAIEAAHFHQLADACDLPREAVGDWAEAAARRARATFEARAEDLFLPHHRTALAAHIGRIRLGRPPV